MEQTEEKDGKAYFQCWDEWDHHSLVVEPGGVGLVKMGFKVEHEKDLAEFEKRIEQFGLSAHRLHRHEDYALGEGCELFLPGTSSSYISSRM